MGSHHLRSALPVLALLAAPARADSLGVVVGPTVALSPADVQAAIAAELGTPIDNGGNDLGTIAVTVDASQLIVTYQRPDGSQLVRAVTLPPVMEDQLELIALVTGSLVRDQLTELPPLAPPAIAQPMVAPPAPTEPAMPMPMPMPMGMPMDQPGRTIPFSIGIIPPLSSDRVFAPVTRGSFGFGPGAMANIAGVSVSAAIDCKRHVRGAQLGGMLTMALATEGVQAAGGAAIARSVRGVQAAGGVATAFDARGLQIAGGTAVAHRIDGIQIAGGAALTGRVEGAQIASLTMARTVHGFQIGAINVAGRAHGLQLGAINIAEDSDGAQIGAINFVRHGRTDLDAWAETNGLGAIALRHGGRYVHNLYAVGWTPDAGATPLVGLGLGVHRPVGTMMLDVDALAWQTHLFQDGVGLLTQARATLAFELGAFAAFVAASYNVSVEDRGTEAPVRMTLARMIDQPMSGVEVALWPSLSAGIRGHFGTR